MSNEQTNIKAKEQEMVEGELIEISRTFGVARAIQVAALIIAESWQKIRAEKTRLQDPADPAPLFGRTYEPTQSEDEMPAAPRWRRASGLPCGWPEPS